ncbi:hypothetical protein SHI21_19765 [Bacteriovorax sp. PP10]|uniref:Pentapeptide MXKDX repeat protein n=1 Tax=Bacteriovorax antarcticus TaxID=3088717 RepID=A0ABU5W1S3_9BACT|nr:hypothetical protein [Bacteriovorax sp. PP10]MEA9358484.1 hypothetical protein [Bacteriovorax sp. PP10]
MKAKLLTSISAITLMGLTSISVLSQEVVDQSHQDHHPDSKTMPNKNIDMKMNSKEMNGMKFEGKDGVMNKEEMTKMNLMMKDCMKIHNDAKMCDQKLMKKEKSKKN